MTTQWRLDRPNAEPRFFATEAEALADLGDGKDVVVWFDSFDYRRYNRGRVA